MRTLELTTNNHISKNIKQQKEINASQLIKQKPVYSKFFLPFVLILTAIIFANMLGNDFASWDDSVNILDNPIIKHFDFHSFKEIFTNFHGTDFPLTIFSYSLEYKFFGLNPFYYHLTNYLIHLFNVLLVYILIRRISGKNWVAFIAALFFGIHPMHVESVAWVSERKDLLYSLFFLLSLNSYCKFLLSKTNVPHFYWSILWFLLSMLSKPAAACLPLVLVLFDYYIEKKITIKSLLQKTPFVLIVIFFFVITVFVQKTFESIPDLTQSFNFIDKVFLFSYSAIYYIIKAFAPFNLCAIHFYPIKEGSLLPFEYYFSFFVLILIVFTAIKVKLLKNEIIFGLLFYFITIIMVLQIIPVGQQAIVAERYSYIPYIGIFFILGHLFYYIIENKKFTSKIKISFSFIIIALATGFSYLTFERNKVWENGIILFTDEINKYPEQGYSWFGRGYSKYEKGDNEGAYSDLSKAIKIYPNDAEFYFNRGNVCNNLSKFENAISDYTSAIKLKPIYPEAFNNRGASYGNLNRLNESLSDYNKAVILNPKYAEAYFGRAITKAGLNDQNGACNDWLSAQQLGYEDATSMLEKYCK